MKNALTAIRPVLPDAPTADAFARRFTLLTLTRNGKDLSRYLWAAKVRDDPRYLTHVPRARETLLAAAAEAAERGESSPPTAVLSEALATREAPLPASTACMS